MKPYNALESEKKTTQVSPVMFFSRLNWIYGKPLIIERPLAEI